MQIFTDDDVTNRSKTCHRRNAVRVRTVADVLQDLQLVSGSNQADVVQFCVNKQNTTKNFSPTAVSHFIAKIKIKNQASSLAHKRTYQCLSDDNDNDTIITITGLSTWKKIYRTKIFRNFRTYFRCYECMFICLNDCLAYLLCIVYFRDIN